MAVKIKVNLTFQCSTERGKTAPGPMTRIPVLSRNPRQLQTNVVTTGRLNVNAQIDITLIYKLSNFKMFPMSQEQQVKKKIYIHIYTTQSKHNARTLKVS